jgi:hypothetical protein
MMIVLAILATIVGVSWPALMRPWSRSRAQQAAQEWTTQLLEARTRAVTESRVYRVRWRPGSGEFLIDTPLAEGGGAAVSPNTADDMSTGQAFRPQEPAGDVPAASEPFAAPADAASSTTSPADADPARFKRPLAFQLAGVLDEGVCFQLDRPEMPLPAATDTPPNAWSGDSRVTEPREISSPDPLAGANQTGQPESVDLIAWSDPVWFYPDGRTSNGHWTLVAADGYQIDVVLRGLTGTVRMGPVRAARPTEDEDPAVTDPAITNPVESAQRDEAAVARREPRTLESARQSAARGY